MPVNAAAGDDARLLESVARAFAPANPARIGIAVSGGGDSMALLHLAQRVVPQRGWQVVAVTVDHGLRPESGDEAATVSGFCAGLGIAHATLKWEGPAQSGNLMDQARRARARLIGDWAGRMGVGHVLLGHTADDQAESFLMNLARGAGLDGLSGLRETWAEEGILWHRPLLGQKRADLRVYLRAQGVAWVDDPSNENERFTRIKARKALAALAPLGITVGGLSQSIAHLRAARQAGEADLHRAVALHVRESAGGLVVAQDTLALMGSETLRRFLRDAVRWISGADYAPRGPQITRLAEGLVRGQRATLGGAAFACQGGQVTITREPQRVAGLICGLGQIWDKRWRIDGPQSTELHVAALGTAGLRGLKNWRESGLTREMLLVSPAVWQGERLISAPLAQKDTDYLAEIVQPFNRFVLSH